MSQSMFMVVGRIIAIFKSGDFTDEKSGEVTKGKHKVQVLGQIPTPDGNGERFDMIDLSVSDVVPYQAVKEKLVRIPLGIFAQAGKVIYFVPKGGLPELVEAAPSSTLFPPKKP